MRAIILSGGSGKRLWPLSSEELPKQYIKNSNNQTGLEKALDLASEIGCNDASIVANVNHKSIVEQLVSKSKIPLSLIYETTAYNTMQAILNGITFMEDTNDWIIVLPTDFEMDKEQFKRFIEASKSNLDEEYLYIFAADPKYAESGFGYVKIREDNVVEEFIEKPNPELASILVEHGYMWNCGIFLFKRPFILKCFEEIYPNRCSLIKKIKSQLSSNAEAVTVPFLGDIARISFDKGITERISKIKALKLDFAWIDVGNWGTYHFSDKSLSMNDNLLTYDAANVNLIGNDGTKKYAVVGLNNITVVESEGLTLIIDKKSAADAKNIHKLIMDTKGSK